MGNPLKVLIVEDLPDDAALLLRELKRGGLNPLAERVDTVESFEAALSSQDWDVILADYCLPSFSGLEALELVQQHGLDVPFIILSGVVGEEAAVAAMKAGAHDYIPKNSLARLVPAVRRELKEAAGRREKRKADETLRENERFIRSTLDSLPLLVLTVDRSGNIEFANRAWTVFARENLAAGLPEGPGQNLLEAFEAMAGDQAEACRSAAAGIRAVILGDAEVFAKEIRLDTGLSGKWFSLQASRFVGEGPVRAVVVMEDITARKLMEERLKYLSLHDSLTGLYNRAYFEEEMRRLEGSCHRPVGIIVSDVDGLKLVNDTMGHQQGDRLLTAAAWILKRSFRLGDLVARTGGDEFVVILANCSPEAIEEACARIKAGEEEYNRKNPALPLSLSVGYAISDADGSEPLSKVFNRADNNMYREKLHRRQSSRHAIVQALTRALEARDFITEGHADRLQSLVVALAQELHLEDRIVSDLRLLAQFHDIGKVGVSDQVLFKPGPLTESEYAEMKRHAEIGYRIALSAPELEPVADWILKHHERWNGTGYPLGLKGEKIPLECRILAIADAYDAMTSDRPYRRAMPHEQAVAELRRNAGTQFDPELVEKFIGIVEKIRSEAASTCT